MNDNENINADLFEDETEEVEVLEKPEFESDKKFNFKFQVTREDFMDFNLVSINSVTKKSDKKNKLMGVVELVIGVLLIVYFFTAEIKPPIIYIALGVLLCLFSTVSLIFYPIFFPRALKKSINSAYDKSGYDNVDIELFIDNVRVLEKTSDGEKEHFWKLSNGVTETDNHYLLQLSEKTGMLIAKTTLGDDLSSFDEFLTGVCNHFELMKRRV